MSTEVANRLLDEAIGVGPRCGTSHIIAIDGPTGSGKTTLADQVVTCAVARCLSWSLIHTDEICPGWDGLPAVPGIIHTMLRGLAAGVDVHYPTWDWHAGQPGDDAALSPTDVVIVEGVGAAARRCTPYLSASVRLDAPTAIRKKRALTRDGDTFAPYWDAWAEAEAHYFAEEGPQG